MHEVVVMDCWLPNEINGSSRHITLRYLTWSDETFKVPVTLLKRAKIKSQWLDHVVGGKKRTIYDGFDTINIRAFNNPFEGAARYVEEYYPQF